MMAREKSELTFKDDMSKNKKRAIEKSPVVNSFIHGEVWVIGIFGVSLRTGAGRASADC